MKAKTFDYGDTVQNANNWYEKHKGLITIIRKETGRFGLTVWYVPKFSEAKQE